MRYSSELENMIEAVVAKGAITDKERKSLINKAIIEGIDPDELNTELDNRIRSLAAQKTASDLNRPQAVNTNNSLFSKELETLIQATLEDGVLEDYEKAALVKRAKAEGVDIAELEIYINSILQKRGKILEKEEKELMRQKEKERKEAFGRRCPNCGAQVLPMTIKCECGYEFTSANSVSSIELFSEKLQAIKSQSGKNEETIEEEIRDLITTFPVPNTKEDIIEFLTLSVPNAKTKGGYWGTLTGRLFIFSIIWLLLMTLISAGESKGSFSEFAEAFLLIGIFFGSWIAGAFLFVALFVDKETLRYNKTAKAWRGKFDQVLMKGRSMRGDPEFQRQLDYYENMFKKHK